MGDIQASSQFAVAEMGGLLNRLWHAPVGDECDVENSHPNITLENNRRTARVTNISDDDVTQVVMSRDTYSVGRHSFRFTLDNIPEKCDTWIGTTSNHSAPLIQVSELQGHSISHVRVPVYIEGQSEGHLVDFYGDLGRPWKTGDVIVLKLDCENHTLIVYHEASGMSHTIHNVTGPQRLYLATGTLNTAISLEPIMD